MARPRGKKRTAAADESSKPEAAVKKPGRPTRATAAAADESSKPEAAVKKPGRPKRARAAAAETAETEYFPEKRNLVRMLQDGLSRMVDSLGRDSILACKLLRVRLLL
jgi:hypothetical protein